MWYLYALGAIVALMLVGTGMALLERAGVIGRRWRSGFRRVGDFLAALLDAA
jgi:hypothetical protein